MSIVHLLAAAAAGPATAPTAADAVTDGPAWLMAVLVPWAVLSLAAAWGLGAFNRRGIAGPERLTADESAWPLLGVFGSGLVTVVVASTIAFGLTAKIAGPDVRLLIAGGTGHLAAAALMLFLLAAARPAWAGLDRLGLSPRRLPAAVAGGTATLFVVFPLVLLAASAVEWAVRHFHAPKTKPHPVLELLMAGRHGWGVAALGVAMAVVAAPLAEEVAFRGVLQTALGRLFAWAGDQVGWWSIVTTGPAAEPAPPPDASPAVATGGNWPHTPAAPRWAAVVVTSALFAAVHGNVAFLLPIFVLSVGLGFAYERSGNLWMTMITHALFNAAEIVLALAYGGG